MKIKKLIILMSILVLTLMLILNISLAEDEKSGAQKSSLVLAKGKSNKEISLKESMINYFKKRSIKYSTSKSRFPVTAVTGCRG